MHTPRPSEHAWSRLAPLAAAAPSEDAALPFGFAGRVVASWQANRRETTLAAFEWLTWRSLAVAVLIFAGSAAFGYDTVSDVITGGAPLVTDWLDTFSLPL